jgi:DNA invertase Pin-like site-specific DNA recombinase
MAKPTGVGSQIIQLRESGLTYNSIVKRLGCAKSTVKYHCDKHGLNDIGFKLVKVSEEMQKKIYDYCQSHSLEEAVNNFGLSLSTIKKFRKKESHIA